MELLVSVHDVMPSTLPRVEALAGRLERAGLAPVQLLVVPGLDWSARDLARLADLASRGHVLAGHGWRHGISGYRNLYHRVHAALLSRRAAEHLSLAPRAIPALMRDCRAWFRRQGLPEPDIYVPPAWALGKVPADRLAATGFRYVEVLSGIIDTDTGRLHRLPVLGFEADTAPRKLALRASNALNACWGRASGRARLAIHPEDEYLLLGEDLTRWIDAGLRAVPPLAPL